MAKKSCKTCKHHNCFSCSLSYESKYDVDGYAVKQELRTEAENLTIYRKAIEKFGKTNQIDMAIEEMAELIKELNKWKRGFNNGKETLLEIADVYIMMHQLTLIFDDAEEMAVIKNIDSKTRRLEGLIK